MESICFYIQYVGCPFAHSNTCGRISYYEPFCASAGLALPLCVFFFAALISGLGEYVYCQYIDPDFIPEQIDAMLKVLESAELDSPEMSDFIATMRSGFEHGALPTAIELVFQMIWTKVFLGSLLSIFVALFVCMYYHFQKSK